MKRFRVQFETTSKSGAKSGITSTTVQASSAMEARQKVKALHPSLTVRVISVLAV